MNTPDVTPAQYAAISLFVAGVATLNTLNVSDNVLCILAATLALVASVAMISDALIRRGRAGMQAAVEATVSALPADLDDLLADADPFPLDTGDADPTEV